jgi:hypothetical protein
MFRGGAGCRRGKALLVGDLWHHPRLIRRVFGAVALPEIASASVGNVLAGSQRAERWSGRQLMGVRQ